MGSKIFSHSHSSQNNSPNNGETGFSLVEVIIAFAIFLVVLFGVFGVFTYSINYNTGNNSRTQALTILQQEVEQLRSAKFTPSVVDSILTGGEKPAKIVVANNGNRFEVKTIIDDDPLTAGIQTDSTKTLKEINLTVTLESPTPGWQTSVPIRVFLRRVRSN